MVAPLADLLKARAQFVWSAECQEAFSNVKSLLFSTPVVEKEATTNFFTYFEVPQSEAD